MASRLALITSALNHMKRVSDHAGGDQRLAMVVKVDTPRVAGAVGKNFELVTHRMITPHASVEGCSLVIGGARFADLAVRENALATIQPTVGAPVESV